MVVLRRVVQFCLGIQAVGMLGSSLVQLFTLLVHGMNAGDNDLTPNAFLIMVAVAVLLAVLGSIPAMAWWTIRTRKPTARRWTLVASILNILWFVSGLQSWVLLGPTSSMPVFAFFGATGVLGVGIFWRKEIKPAVPKPIRPSGDGTNPIKDYTAQALSFAILWISFRWWRQWSDGQGLEQPGFITGVLLFQLAIVLTTLIHELGHYGAGWASQMILRRFQVGPFQWAIRNGRWTFRLRLKDFYGGAIGMVTPRLDNIRGREAFLILGGPVASLVFAAAATTAVLGAKGHSWEPYWAFLSMCAGMGWASFVTNLIPMQSAARYSDGAQLCQLMRGGEWAQVHIAFAMVASSLVTSIRPRDFNVAILHRAAEFIKLGERGLLLRLFAAAHYFDTNRIPEALASIEAAEALYEEGAFEKDQDICAEFLFINAFYKRDLGAAEMWWQRIEALGQIDRDADYWRARTALFLLKGEQEYARQAWDRGNNLAQKLPTVGMYEGTRASFAKLWIAVEFRTAAPV